MLQHEDDERETSPGADRWLGPFFEEPGLWPVLIAAVGSLSAFGAAAFVLAFADRNVLAMAAIAIAAGLTLFALGERHRAGRPLLDRVMGLVASLWLTSALLGWGATRWLSG